MGTPFLLRRCTIGTMPHSQEGKATPSEEPNRTPKNLFLGIIRAINFSDKKDCIKPDIKAPIKTKGSASIKMEMKIVFICKNEWGSDWNNEATSFIYK